MYQSTVSYLVAGRGVVENTDKRSEEWLFAMWRAGTPHDAIFHRRRWNGSRSAIFAKRMKKQSRSLCILIIFWERGAISKEEVARFKSPPLHFSYRKKETTPE